MAGRKKIIKKKLKQPDEFITLTEKAFLFITHQYKKIAIGGLLLLVIVLSIFIFQTWQEKKEGEAYQKLSSALEIYQMANSPYREGAPTEYKNVLGKLDEIITQFPRTPSGKISLLYKGNVHLRLGEFDEAVKAYQTFLQKGGEEKLYRLFAMEGLGYAYEGKKDYEKASDAYQKIVHMGDHFQMATAYLGLGRCYEKLGKNKEALENYRSFLSVSEKSIMTNVVLGRISHLENKL
jgi:tetratricopeptide (TPR) repeat protein